MSVVRRHIGEGAVSPAKLNIVLRNGTYVFEKFNYQPRLTDTDGYSAPTGATGDLNLAHFRNLSATYHVKGAGQTLLGPVALSTTAALDVSQDQTDNEGVEYIFGQFNTAGNPLGLTVGAAAGKARFARLKFSIVDVSGTDDCAFGFRKVQAAQANIDDYTDAAVLNVISGDVFTETILNNAATTSVDTTENWADGETHELKVVVSAAGVARFYFDGQEVGSPFTFDSGDALVPFFFFLHAADVAGAVEFIEFEAGAVEDVDDYYIL